MGKYHFTLGQYVIPWLDKKKGNEWHFEDQFVNEINVDYLSQGKNTIQNCQYLLSVIEAKNRVIKS